MNLTAIRQKKKVFEKEVVFNPSFQSLDIKSVFIDKKSGEYRVIIIGDDNDDYNAIVQLAEQYFAEIPFKVITREGNAEGTINTGGGVIQSQNNGWGTLGGIFTVQNQDGLFGLSNNHVIADTNNAPQNAPVQFFNEGEVGKLFRYINLKDPPEVNYMDAAIFKFNENIEPTWSPAVPQGKTGPTIHMQVYKNGYATQITNGYIKSYDGAVNVNLNGQLYYFKEVITILGTNGTFSDFGDSGSIVLTKNHFLVAVLFAKYGNYAYALPIKNINPLLR